MISFFIVITAASIAACVIMASVKMAGNSWRHCTSCNCYFNVETGEITFAPTLLHPQPGVCHDCCCRLEGRL